MLVKEVVDTNYANVFLNFEGEERTAQIKAVQYIQYLGNSLEIDVSDWDLFEVFGAGNGKIYQTKTAINQRFFAYVDKLPKKENAVSPEVAAFSPKIMANLSSLIQAHRTDAAARVVAQIADYARRADERYMRFDESMRQLAHLQAQKAALTGGAMPDLPKQIDTINKAGFWKLDTFDEISSTLFFRTTKDVLMQHVNTAAGLDLHVNFGRFATSIQLKTTELRVLADGNNMNLSGHIHPHIGSQGQVCWGNAAHMVSTSLPSLNLVPVMEALAVILTHYNEESPYVSIERFHQVQNKNLMKLMKVCDYCEVEYAEGEQCRCDYCEVCGQRYDYDNGQDCSCCYDCNEEHCVCGMDEETDEEAEEEPVVDDATTAREGYGRSPALQVMQSLSRAEAEAAVNPPLTSSATYRGESILEMPEEVRRRIEGNWF